MLTEISGFISCAAVILFAGKKLSYYGDLLADVTGLGKAWIGLILMATVTSLPELMVGISSVTIVKSADLAVGDILGSCAFNLAILSIMDIFMPKQDSVFSHASKGNILAASFGAILVTLPGFALVFRKDIPVTQTLGLVSLLICIIYLLAIYTLYRYQRANPIAGVASSQLPDLTVRQIVLRYSGYALLITVAALVLPHFADRLADITGLGKTFMGTLFLAASTSLPELAVSIAAIRMGSTDLAIGNLLGSNMFDIFILFLSDVFYVKGHLLSDASPAHVISIFFVILMTVVAIIGLVFPAREKRISLSFDTMGILLLYLINITILFFIK